MERLVIRSYTARKALLTLEDSLKLLQLDVDDRFAVAFRNSTIKSFEYCYEATWKLLKQYLELVELQEPKSPRSVFSICYDVAFISRIERDQFFKMIDHRNETSHVYSLESAEEILVHISSHYSLMIEVVRRVEVRLRSEQPT